MDDLLVAWIATKAGEPHFLAARIRTRKGRDAVAPLRFLNDGVYCSPPETFAPHKALAPHKAFAPHRALLPHTPLAPQSAFAPQGSFAPHKALRAPTLLFAVIVAAGAPTRNCCAPQTT